MKKILVALSLLLTLVISLRAIAQEDYPRTPSGKPDFNGDYDIYPWSRAQWWVERFTPEKYNEIDRSRKHF